MIEHYTSFKENNKTLSWQQQLSQSKITVENLFNQLHLDAKLLDGSLAAHKSFALRVPQAFIARMRKSDINDPLLKQILPINKELDLHSGFSSEPLEEAKYTPMKGVIHKYTGRILIITTGACAVNCRYCFRRHFPYNECRENKNHRQQLLTYLQANKDIKEVILSGGDPLIATDAYLAELIKDIASVANITTIRIHTRLPIMIPDRITNELLAILSSTRLTPVMVIHCNHAAEIDKKVKKSLTNLKQTGIILLNQSVLLHGVNDSVNSLYDLSQELFASGVIPYYLHLLDKVQGAYHFAVEQQQAIALMQQFANLAPGYLVPKLVKEIPGELSKTRVF